MTVKKFKATIKFMAKVTHPDIKYIDKLDDPTEKLSFSDTYTLDENRFLDVEHMKEFIKHDLSLVASGGYSKEHIKNVSFQIKRIK